MNYTVVFAGGTGQRMNTVSVPKQFLKVHGKEIIVRTIEHFQNCSEIDGIVIVCLEDYIDEMKCLIDRYDLNKVLDVVPGGANGQESIYNGLVALKKFVKGENDVVLIHDGVRPIMDEKTIIANIECVNEKGTAITVAKANETVLVVDGNFEVNEVVDRTACYLGRAPQSFKFKQILDAHERAINENKHDFIDSAMLMKYYGYKMHTVVGPTNNIKVTTPMDYYLFQAMLDIEENEQIKNL